MHLITTGALCLLVYLTLGCGGLPAWAQQGPTVIPSLADVLARVSGSRIQQDVVRLSDPSFRGRLTGTADDLTSALFVADRFQAFKLRPAGTEPFPSHPTGAYWLQTMPVRPRWIGLRIRFALRNGDEIIPVRAAADYLPVLDSPTVSATAPVVFVGYGISDSGRGVDDYAGVEVTNRVVLFLRGQPGSYSGRVSQEEKIRTARGKGAVGFLTVTGPIVTAYEARRGLTGAPMGSFGAAPNAIAEPGIAGCWISTALGEQILASAGRSLRAVQEALDRGLHQSVTTPMHVTIEWESQDAPGVLFNVLGILPAVEAVLPGGPGEAIVLGAHRDHLGSHAGLLFPGADDNASGTAVMLEVARVLTLSGLSPTRSIVFASFSGEEVGLSGSRLYVSQPSVALGKTIAMINLDHAGIGNGRLTIGVAGLAKSVAEEAGNLAGLDNRLDLFGYFPGGDHVSFKEAGVATVTIVSSGRHPDFHQPSDTADKVKPEILEAIARYVVALVWQLANRP